MDVNRDIDALSQLTRAELFDVLCQIRRPASTDELAERLGRHPNGIRQHLERMRESGLVLRELDRRGRGRPRDLWAVDPTAKPGGHDPTAYAELGNWLARAIDGGPVNPEAIEAKGYEIGLELADAGHVGTDPLTRFRDALSAMGFQPSIEPSPSPEVAVCLNNCPYRDVARDRQPLICALHKGVSAGLLESIDPTAELTGLEPRDPDKAGCMIRIRGPLIEKNR